MVAMSNEKRFFTYGKKTIDYSLIYADRKTMEIAVHPDSTVIVKAPIDSELSLIEKKLLKRARWILKQLNYFRQFIPRTLDKRFISGETHRYLGKQYRLKVTQGERNSVKLTRGFFQVTTREKVNPELTKKLMHNWYLQKAQHHYDESLDRCWPKFSSLEVMRPKISIRRMQKRWGSLSKSGNITLNTTLIRAPKECIDYVVTHELCHLKYHDHSPEFYMLLDSVSPGWKKIKHKLELSMA